MSNEPATAAHVSYFKYTGDTLDPDFSAGSSKIENRSAEMWTLAVSAACIGAALSRILTR
ncbi:hypothetical protein M3B51_00675 [Kocuria carniphila]|uniref:hypothetical protein n=1 Tax=Kocuria carniphila TaxID=262208 RepID=UPI0021A57174|nr:hypothetical protein [Kocuria carniphila]MCT1801304.1 hypothetical protein [Kocuria carniphila]